MKILKWMVLGLCLSATTALAQMDGMDHGNMDHGGSHGNMDHGSMDHGDRVGTLFHESQRNGYTLSYYLMDMRRGGSMDKMADKPHHIMVYITDARGKIVSNARVGIWIKDAKGEDQKSMAMYMSNGFGTMADMGTKGRYIVSTKVLIGKKKVLDRFHYVVK